MSPVVSFSESAAADARPICNARFFIVGAGRSGTTLLRLILCGHSRLHVAPETWFITDLAKQLPLTGALTPAQVSAAVQIMTAHYRWPDLAYPESMLRAEVARIKRPDMRALIDLVYARQEAISGKSRIGDKTPVYVQCLPALIDIYPDAKFIHLLRDGRDVALSYIKAEWPHRCYEGELFEWTSAVRHAASFNDKSRLLVVRYEDLVASTANEIARICDFLGETFEPNMLAFNERAGLVPSRERHVHNRLRGSVDGASAGAWRRLLSVRQCFVMEACLWRDLLENGYELRFAGRCWRWLLRAAGLALVAARPALLRWLPALQRRGFFRGF